MKMTKRQNIALSIVFVTVLIVATVSITFFSKNIIQDSYALGTSITSVNVTNGSDIVSIRANSSNGIAGYYIGTSDNLASATYYRANGKISFNVSLLNGTYYFWVKDNSGQITKYNKAVTVNNSCSSDFVYNVTGSGSIKHCYYTSDGSYLEETKSEELIKCANGYVRDSSQTRVTQDTCSSLNSQSIANMGVSKKVCYKVWTYACVSTGGGQGTPTTSLSVQSATTSNDWTQGNKEIKVTAQKGNSNIAGYYISTSSAKPNANSEWKSSTSTSWSTTQPAGTYYIWVKDEAGNISNNYKSVTVSKIDNTAPVIDSVIPSSGNKTITINASDSESGVGSYYISENDSTPNANSAWESNNIISKEAGVYYVWVKDNVGNISQSKKVTMASSSKTDNNSLSSLSISGVELTPEFNQNTLEYTATANTSKIKIDATLADSNASFTKNYGPRTVNLKSGKNNVLVKVKSALGNEKEYKIVVTYTGKSSSSTSSARLKSLKLNSGNLTFDPDITEYRMYVPVSLEKLEVTATPEDENATVEVENPETLEIGDNNVKINVTATDGTKKIYSLRIIKKETEEISTNNYLKSLTISGYEIEFKRDILSYDIKLGNKTSLNVNAVAEDSNAEVTIDNTKNLTKDSVIKVMVRAEDGSARIYYINLNKQSFTVLKIILIILGVLVGLVIIAVIVLKILGYSIYINFGAIKDLFSRIFNRNKD